MGAARGLGEVPCVFGINILCALPYGRTGVWPYGRACVMQRGCVWCVWCDVHAFGLRCKQPCIRVPYRVLCVLLSPLLPPCC